MICNGCNYKNNSVKTYLYICKNCNKGFCDRNLTNCGEYHKRKCKTLGK